MDVLESLLVGPRARGAFVLQAVLDPPWAIRVQDRAPLAIVASLTGGAWVAADGGAAQRLAPGDIAVFRGPDPYLMADDPATPPFAIVHPGNRCESIDGQPLVESMALGVRTWGNAVDGGTRLLIGAYDAEGAVSRRLLDRLPPVVVHRAVDDDPALVRLLAAEATKDAPGQAAVLDRLLDLLLIRVLRAWLAGQGAAEPAWSAAATDPIVGRALNLIHHNPGHPWTVGSLAAEAGVSRAGLAARFTDLVGEPPIGYLTRWRLDLAADLLVDPDRTVQSVARQVGYASGFALSTAFKRGRGVSPTQHRRGGVGPASEVMSQPLPTVRA